MISLFKAFGEWNYVFTWEEYWEKCCKFAKSLIFLGVNKYKIVNILGFNAVSRYNFTLTKQSGYG
jgi:long-subunit acyl-CoA synthetase (AMP-forming)